MQSKTILSLGSVSFDSIQTPSNSMAQVLGGSANYFSLSASFFTPVQVVSVVGKDFPSDHLSYLRSRGIDTQGIEIQEGKTFYWQGEYKDDYNEAITQKVELNVFKDFNPALPPSYCETEYIFLGNITPDLQIKTLDQIKKPKLIALDSMNIWITSAQSKLKQVLKRVDILIINDRETRLLGDKSNTFAAAEKIMEMGPKCLVVKRGEYGSFLLANGKYFMLPAVPLKKIKDPTGAGDTFAGGFLGHMARSNANLEDTFCLKEALLYGTVMASFTVQDFSFEKIRSVTREKIQERYQEMLELIRL